MKIRTPRVYRYLERQFVDQFFHDGAIRISSFSRFRQHPDETRLDTREGFGYFIHRTSAGTGETLILDYECAPNLYCLCASALPSANLMRRFKGAESAIVIWDTIKFSECIRAALSAHYRVIEDIQGPCSYQLRRVVERDLGQLDLGRHDTENPKDLDQKKLEMVISELVTQDLYFIKRETYVDEAEYRFIWAIDGHADDYLDLHVPDARKFCSRWEDHGAWIAVDNTNNGN